MNFEKRFVGIGSSLIGEKKVRSSFLLPNKKFSVKYGIFDMGSMFEKIYQFDIPIYCLEKSSDSYFI